MEACLILGRCNRAAPAHFMIGRCTLPTQGLLELVQIMACLAPASEANTRPTPPRLLPVIDCLAYVTLAQTVSGLAEAFELLVILGSSGMTTRTKGLLLPRKGREDEDNRARHR